MDISSIEKYTKDGSSGEPEVKQSKEEVLVERFVAQRVTEMQDYRKELGVEKVWKEADLEYEPKEIELSKKRRYESDDELGLRARLVPVGDSTQDWRSNNSDPTLLTKVQTAISIIIDNNPEAKLKAVSRKYEKKTALAYSLWKRNWGITNAKEVYKLFCFNLAKYGWAVGRTFPRLIQFPKEILTEVNQSDPSKNVYEKKMLTWFNDVAKQNMDPFRTWIDEQTKPYDDYSMNDCYFELDYSWDQAKIEFEQYGFDKFVPEPRNLRVSYEEDPSQGQEDDEEKKRKDLVTVGFYENRAKDLYVIRIPKKGKILHYCPLPNDDGLLSLWHSPWILADASRPYGISLWQIIKQKKGLYDKMQNMTMDQLVLSIMKMFFYTGTNNLIGNGKIKIEPGKGVQIVNGKVDFLDIPGPGDESWKGLDYLRQGMEDDSGITRTLQGDSKGQTLGQDLISKESSLKRLKIPVENIADAIEQDAYITLSWTAQVLSTPEIKQFADEKEIADYEGEMGVKRQSVVPMGGLDPMTNEAVGPFQASLMPEISLEMEQQGDKLVESRSERFFAIGTDIKAEDLKWRGIFKVEPKSILQSSSELEKQSIDQLGNMIAPLLVQPPEIYAKLVNQWLKNREQNPLDWLPESWLPFLDQGQQPLFIQDPMMQAAMQPMGQGVPTNQTSMQGAAGTTPSKGGPTVVPQNQMSVPKAPGYSAAPRNELTRAQGQ